MNTTQSVHSTKSNKKKPLKIACSNTDCRNGLHYFGPSARTKKKSKHPPGKCIDCGADFVDWQRVGTPKSDDDYKLSMFQREWIRHHFWQHYRPSERDVNYARRKGTSGLVNRAQKVLRNKVFTVTGHLNDIQIPYSGVIPAAQHATATCCRKCIEYWHGIPRDSKPNDAQIAYLSDWIMKFVAKKYPAITQNGEKVPPIRSKK